MKINTISSYKAHDNVQQNQQQPAFKGWVSNLGNKLTKDGKLLNLSKSIEFNGVAMPFSVLATTCFVFILLMRSFQAQSQMDKEEIIRRDSTTIGTLLFGAPIFGKVLSKTFEKTSGFALIDKKKSQNVFGRIWDYLKPHTGHQVLSSGAIERIYSNVDRSKNGILDFCDFVTKNGGNLRKIFSSNKDIKQHAATALGQSVEAFSDNNSIREAFAQRMQNAPETLKGLYKALSKADNPLVKKAKFLNATFGFVSTFVLVPFCLGFLILKINEKITKSKLAKIRQEEKFQQESQNRAVNLAWNTKFNKVNFLGLK